MNSDYFYEFEANKYEKTHELNIDDIIWYEHQVGSIKLTYCCLSDTFVIKDGRETFEYRNATSLSICEDSKIRDVSVLRKKIKESYVNKGDVNVLKMHIKTLAQLYTSRYVAKFLEKLNDYAAKKEQHLLAFRSMHSL